MSVLEPYIAIRASEIDATKTCSKTFLSSEGCNFKIASCNINNAILFLCVKILSYLSAPVDEVILILLFTIYWLWGNLETSTLSNSIIFS